MCGFMWRMVPGVKLAHKQKTQYETIPPNTLLHYEDPGLIGVPKIHTDLGVAQSTNDAGWQIGSQAWLLVIPIRVLMETRETLNFEYHQRAIMRLEGNLLREPWEYPIVR